MACESLADVCIWICILSAGREWEVRRGWRRRRREKKEEEKKKKKEEEKKNKWTEKEED